MQFERRYLNAKPVDFRCKSGHQAINLKRDSYDKPRNQTTIQFVYY